MPRISAPTVAEHRERQVRTLLDAAGALVAEEGPQALTLAALARRVGLSRPGLYEYFRSKDDLVAAVVEEALPRWAARVEDAVTTVEGPAATTEAYVRVQLDAMTDGGHAAAVALVEHALTAPARERVRRRQARLLRPLIGAFAEAGVPDAVLRAELVQGIVDAAAHAVRRDPESSERITDTAADQAVRGLPRPAGPDVSGGGPSP
ncbi:TetR/AcrR family transcriptional regulator [Thermomonospora umbrina]|uniref:TetR family transcriptional regulator n=1 Tax=Thermomonospora umbrina TaxID=111806 RepID=A0A3D9SHF5_9ACTN|nr:TetR/AcrR family transcriptional regulator [Thermomonospora umbrina]REE95127.1 TetR family transcriptional regulator [Thermomonospora umbrina]